MYADASIILIMGNLFKHNKRKRVKKLQNARKAWELFINGYSVADIASEMDLHNATIRKYINDEMSRAYDRIEGMADKFVAVEAERLDVMTRALMKDLIKDTVVEDVDADGNVIKVKRKQVDKDIASTLLKVQERRAKYLSLDAPERKEVTTTLSLEGLVLQSQTRLEPLPQAPDDANMLKEGRVIEIKDAIETTDETANVPKSDAITINPDENVIDDE